MVKQTAEDQTDSVIKCRAYQLQIWMVCVASSYLPSKDVVSRVENRWRFPNERFPLYPDLRKDRVLPRRPEDLIKESFSCGYGWRLTVRA